MAGSAPIKGKFSSNGRVQKPTKVPHFNCGITVRTFVRSRLIKI